VSEPLFDLADEYEAMLMRGVSLSGEHWSFFARGRVEDLQRRLATTVAPRRILDFGCGIGYTTDLLGAAFPAAEVVGIDTSVDALRRAEEAHGSARVRFEPVEGFSGAGTFDLCYTNGVFHHIEPAKRAEALALIRDALTETGYFALFENNPWNPGTRMVMRRIPFDRDAQMLSPVQARRFLRDDGWRVAACRSLFYFPRALAALRTAEPWLTRWPLGAQYYILAQPPVPTR
jgi:trans-aconitate methyltransferase